VSIEFDKYEKHGAYHWDDFAKKTIYRNHALHVANWVKGKNVLDIGCGDGLITSLLRAKGIDNHELAISMAKDRGVDAQLLDAYDCATLTDRYDAVYLGDTIEHLEYPDKVLKSIASLTDDLYIVTPQKGWRDQKGKRRPLDRYHYREYTQDELRAYVKRFGWGLVSIAVANRRIYAHFRKIHIVVYTAIFGGKDRLIDPLERHKGVDFVCFTDDPKMRSNIWDVRVCSPTNDNPCRAAKVFKVRPHHYFPDHEYSLWIDGNLRLMIDPKTLLTHLDDAKLACFDHYERSCIYDEANICIKKGLDDPVVIQRQMAKYRTDNYPPGNGLLYGGVLLRRHNVLAAVMNGWWEEIENHSRRDQLSLPYVLSKNDCDYAIIPGYHDDNKSQKIVRKLYGHYQKKRHRIISR